MAFEMQEAAKSLAQAEIEAELEEHDLDEEGGTLPRPRIETISAQVDMISLTDATAGDRDHGPGTVAGDRDPVLPQTASVQHLDETDAIKMNPMVFQLLRTNTKKEAPASKDMDHLEVPKAGSQKPVIQRSATRMSKPLEETCYFTGYAKRGTCLILEWDEFRADLGLSDRKGGYDPKLQGRCY